MEKDAYLKRFSEMLRYTHALEPEAVIVCGSELALKECDILISALMSAHHKSPQT